MQARLLLQDGTLFTGTAFGAEGEKTGEVVFNTGITGYQEVLSDPSYCGQIVTMTYPLIGNYGITRDDFESVRPLYTVLLYAAMRKCQATGAPNTAWMTC